MRIEISPAATVDLDEIWFYGVDQWNVKQATRYQTIRYGTVLGRPS